MCGKTNTAEDCSAGIIPTASRRVAEVTVLPGYQLKVRFLDDTVGLIDMSRLIFSDEAGVFAALRDQTLFTQAHLELGAVTWPGEIDLAPDAMYTEIKQQGKWVLE
ncbi:MAG: DUF2442 domain-containing protein [Syntrophobacteraceae bacterium]